MTTLICPKCNRKTTKGDLFCSKCGSKLIPVSEGLICHSCGAKLKQDAVFCTQCGVRQNTPESYVCGECGTAVKSGEKFCSKCGTEVRVFFAAEQKSEIETIFQKALEHYKNSRYVSAFVLLKDAAKYGHPKAQYYLGQSYRFGKGVKQDINEAAKWERAAKEQGIDETSMTENRTILQGKAELGDADAQCQLGVILINDGWTFVASNNNSSGKTCFMNGEKWLRKAAEQNYAPAQTQLAFYYSVYPGVITLSRAECVKEALGFGNRDEMSAEWYRIAAEQGNAEAQWHLGICYENGFGVKKNKAKAFNLYCMAAKEGVGETHVGECYRRGIGTTKDESEAIKWFRKAKEHGQISLLYKKRA